MRFAFTAAQSNCTWAELAELWDVADELDVFSTGWVYDHFYPLRTGPEEPTLEGWTCLAMLLARTSRLRGGVMVTGIPYRHPAVLANMAVTVDIASGGRLELGVGAGWFEPECAAYGIELGSITERFDRFEEALTVIRSLLTAADDDVRRALLPAPRRVVRAEGGAAAAPADRARRQGRAPAAPAGRPLRRPLELLRRRPGGVRPAARLAWASCARPRAAASTTSRCRPTSGRRRRPARDRRQSPPTARPAPQMISRPAPRPYDPRCSSSSLGLASLDDRCQLTDEVGQLAHERLLQHGADERHVRRRVGAGERLAGTSGWRRRP